MDVLMMAIGIKLIWSETEELELLDWMRRAMTLKRQVYFLFFRPSYFPSRAPLFELRDVGGYRPC